MFDIINVFMQTFHFNGVNKMKSGFFIKKAFCLVFAIFIALYCGMTAFAVDYDGDGIDDDEPIATEVVTEYVETEPEPAPEPETEPVTEPSYEPETEPEYEPETEPEYEPETEPETETEYIEPVEPEYSETTPAYVETYPIDDNSTTDYQAPTLAKTVSTKTYSTNYTAGIVSWLCVGVGVITVSVVLISTKASGRKQRRG